MIYLRAGSRFERPGDNGLSHFLEHMLFRGTQQYPSAHLLATAFEDLGGTLDACTAADHGTLGIDVPLECLDAVLPLLASVYAEPLLSDLEVERGVIREEVLEDLGERGQLIDPPTLLRQLAFEGHGLGRPIIGPLANIERFERSDIEQHHERTYIGPKTVVSVAGHLDPVSVMKSLESVFQVMAPGAPPTIDPPPKQAEPRFRFVNHGGSTQTNVTIGYCCPGHQDRMEPAVEMLLRIIDDGMATRLYHELCDKRGLCYSTSGSYEAYDDTGLIELEASAASDRAAQVLRQMLSITSGLVSERVTEAEFQRARKRARWQLDAYHHDPMATADFLAVGQFTGTARSPEERLQQLLDVSRDDIREAASRIFAATNRNVVAVGASAPDRQLEELARGVA